MKIRARAAAGAVLGAWLALGAASPACAQTSASAPTAANRETVVTHRATGTFEVKLAPQATETDLGRMSLDKRFHGDLQGTGKGEMLAAQTAVEGSAGYVAMERVTGSLHGRSGTFVLQHSGTMNRGAPQLVITVVPDSGTGQLAGLAGRMMIIIADGKHSYEFEYTLAATTP